MEKEFGFKEESLVAKLERLGFDGDEDLPVVVDEHEHLIKL